MRDEGAGRVWAVSFIFYAGIMLIMTGVFQVIQGIAALFQNNIFLITADYVFKFDATVWGWIHIIVGLLAAASGFYLFYGKLWARIIGIIAAVLSAVTNFLYIPYYPIWSILIIALDMAVIWALAFHGRELAD